jgi:hypothetical protein
MMRCHVQRVEEIALQVVGFARMTTHFNAMNNKPDGYLHDKNEKLS